MRGKGICYDSTRPCLWITPAYAGKSRKPVHRRKPVQDHPRLCGEKRCPLWCPLRFRGSPPPMRGKASYGGWLKEVRQDHPRLCGEKVISAIFVPEKAGSPPPMRGKVQSGFFPAFQYGITPAYAGKSILLNGFRDNP